MRRNELADTLIELTRGLDQAHAAGMSVTDLDIELPLEVTAAVAEGKLVFLASPPHSRWRSGVLPPVHRAHLRVTVGEATEPAAPPEAGVEG